MSNLADSAVVVLLANVVSIVPPTIMAYAALQSSKRTERKVGDVNGTTIADATLSQDSTLRLIGAILDRIDERVEAVEKRQVESHRWHDNHEKWHAAGMPERRKNPR